MESTWKHFNLREHKNIILLFLGMGIAVLIWLWWMESGISFVHSRVSRRIPDTIAAALTEDTKTNTVKEKELARDKFFSEMGQTGDSFGGLNALLTAIAGVSVLWAGFLQNRSLKHAQAQAKEERDARHLQEFEALFFRLLALSSEVTNRIEARTNSSIDSTGDASILMRQGPAALASFASSLSQRAHAISPEIKNNPNAWLEHLVSLFLTHVYDRRPSAFGPYFRILYQTFQHISNSHLPYETQIKYANIARGQISEGAVLLLALNGLTVDGYKFVPLIEKFGLLEHLHRKYSKDFMPLLKIGYRDRAFLGREERSKPENAFVETPKLQPNNFSKLEENRKLAEDESEFDAGFSGSQYVDP